MRGSASQSRRLPKLRRRQSDPPNDPAQDGLEPETNRFRRHFAAGVFHLGDTRRGIRFASTVIASRSRLIARQRAIALGGRSRSDSLATFAANRCASSRVSRLAAARLPGSPSSRKTGGAGTGTGKTGRCRKSRCSGCPRQSMLARHCGRRFLLTFRSVPGHPFAINLDRELLSFIRDVRRRQRLRSIQAI
jgi:hypothetical protein